LEKIPNDRGLLIFVDYAHTPEALARVGENLRKFARGRMITVFGCGGDRDRSKRPLMGREAALFSDLVIVTSDNPRTEDPEAIIDEILPGFEEVGYPKDRIFRIASREEALQKALEIARRGDLVLVAGKGHEDYQVLGTKKVHFSDQEVLEKLLKVE
jgi:UDP-N-acetylmuramoyl-L-alanyl-D-glutamate--2,6-diaminopimelate ligase